MPEMYPMTEPHDQGLLDVGDGHHVHWETSGNPEGKPAVVLHGGPGQGSAPGMRRMFDPARYRIVLLDQRGCGRSVPHGTTSLRDNTTEHLVADLERLREHLRIERWLVTGGSWGTTLALVYAERFPERVTELVLSAISTTRRSEIDWLYRGVGRFFPEEWARFSLGADDDVAAYARLMADPDPAVRDRAVAAWCRWEDVVLSLEPGASPVRDMPVDDAARAFAVLTAHYYAHAGWLEEGAVIRDAGRLAGIPGVLIHGRLDLSCPVTTAWELAAAWPGAELLVDDHSGHRASDVKRAWKLAALDRFAR
ncbi:proline iminopeptidase [Amycolatopsis sp. NBRC 101858]|uniref:prolyl aminopeptidase n=1 Tax=Amycolatopsis sp. NBRC 101858 TaxID=3032200 RepID=UPI0024A30E8B|nr:prolyl aminopeptidase [Amycolatopsis sp. NBRC 101858]GLY40560.1 proline iminopeptidase [Amycolatopsis sp. NBRC 101858]